MEYMIFNIAQAASPGLASTTEFVARVNEVILFPLITLLTAIAFLFFMYGCFIYISNANNPAAREVGRGHIMWGIVGMFVMLSAFGILSVAANTFGLKDELDCADDPSAPGCNGTVFTLPSADGGLPPVCDETPC